jgi:NADPH-dependent ferric siderophore reductase
VALGGERLDEMVLDEPASAVRLFLPRTNGEPPTTTGEGRRSGKPRFEDLLPTWRGNEFLLSDGTRPAIRTFTVRRWRPEESVLELLIVIHGPGAASDWAAAAEPGQMVAVSGPRRGARVDQDASAYVLLGDETATAALSRLLEALPGNIPVDVHVEVAELPFKFQVPSHPRASVTWHEPLPSDPSGESLVGVIEKMRIEPGLGIWAAGEAVAMQRIRRHLFHTLGLPRSRAEVRGYWKRGRAAETATLASTDGDETDNGATDNGATDNGATDN